MILVCGGLADPVTELVCARLSACGYAYRLLDLGVYPAGFQIHWQWRTAHPEGYIAGPDWVVDLGEVTGVYVRSLGHEGRLPVADVAEENVPGLYAEHDAGLTLLLEDLPCAVVNRLRGRMSNRSKPYQAVLIQQCGLRTPPTLMTNDPDAARRFYDACDGDVICKSLSGARSILRRVGHAELARLSLLRRGPAQFQAFVSGDDVRVHVVGERLFAARLRSAVVDYRCARRDVEMVPIELPSEVAAACLRVARALDLLMAGVDLKVTPGGDYYCVDVNPSPSFLYYEQQTGQPISTALADLLHKGLSRDDAAWHVTGVHTAGIATSASTASPVR